MKSLRILLADDHELVCEGLRALIEREPTWKVCGTAATGQEAVEKTLRLRPDIVVLDMGMPGKDGLETLREVRTAAPGCEVLIFTGTDSDELIRLSYEQGAKGFILKSEALPYLHDALCHLSEHRPFFTEKVSDVVFARFSEGKREAADRGEHSRLTRDEETLVKLLADGYSNETAAKKRKVSIRTVENQRAEIMRKLKFQSFTDLVRYALRNGLVAD